MFYLYVFVTDEIERGKYNGPKNRQIAVVIKDIIDGRPSRGTKYVKKDRKNNHIVFRTPDP